MKGEGLGLGLGLGVRVRHFGWAFETVFKHEEVDEIIILEVKSEV